MAKTLNLTLKVWRQENREAKGRIETYAAKDIPVDASFLEMLDIVNEGLVKEGKEPIHFDHDCREGICGMCSLTINGIPHGPERQVTTCQLHMRKFKDGDTVWIEPFRAKAFPILRDLMVDRSALDRIIASGGYIDVRTGSAPNANNIAVEKVKAEAAFDAAAYLVDYFAQRGSHRYFYQSHVVNLACQGKYFRTFGAFRTDGCKPFRSSRHYDRDVGKCLHIVHVRRLA